MLLQHFDWWVYIGWWFINIPVPVALPLAVLYIVGKLKSPPSSSHALKSIGRGELFWAAMAMAAAASSEIYALRLTLSDSNLQGVATASIALMVLVILFSVLYVGFGSTAPPGAGATPHIPNQVVYKASIRTLIFTIVAYSASHWIVMAHEVTLKLEAQEQNKNDKNAIIKRVSDCLASPKGKSNRMRCVEDEK